MVFDYSRLSPSPDKPLCNEESVLHRPLAIAEIGTAHGGDLQRGFDLIDAASEAGADVAKVQVVFAEEILPPEAGLVPLPGGETALYEVFRKLEKAPEFYAALAEHAEKRELGFLASPFGMRSIALLEEVGVRAWKVASPELNHEPLLERLAGTGLPLILSTGVAKPADIQRALELVASAAGCSDEPPTACPSVTLLHCLTSYPAPENQANLRAIPAMTATYGKPAGLSDHSLNPVLLPALATALGAVMVEKHITLSRSDGGLDDPVALVPEDFARMTAAMRHFAAHIPSSSPEERLKSVMEELRGEFSRGRIEATLGDGSKHLAPAEEALYGRTNRSLHAIGPLPAGTLITEKNTALLRTEKILRPGIPPRRRHEAYGRRLTRDVASGDGITWKDFE